MEIYNQSAGVLTTDGRWYHVDTAAEKFMNDGLSSMAGNTRQRRIKGYSIAKVSLSRPCEKTVNVYLLVTRAGSTRKNSSKLSSSAGRLCSCQHRIYSARVTGRLSAMYPLTPFVLPIRTIMFG